MMSRFDKAMKIACLATAVLLLGLSGTALAKMTVKDKVGDKQLKLQIYGFSQFEVRAGNGMSSNGDLFFKAQRIRMGFNYFHGPIAGKLFRRAGARSGPQLDYDFPGVTCISVNDEAVHGIPGKRRLREGDLVKLDVTAELDGFYERLFFERNRRMVARLLELGQDGRTRFVVLGAGHMLGEEGIPALLARQGYRVELLGD